MIASPRDEDTYKALRLIGQGEAWPFVRDWLEENLKRLCDTAATTYEPNALNRLVGEIQTISSVLEEVGNAPRNEALFAKTDSSREIGLAPGG